MPVPPGDGPLDHTRTAILVSGMHRSGTSAITRVASMLGAALPGDLIEARADNERGFWEGRPVVALDERALERFGSWWGGWQSIDPKRLRNRERLVAEARQLLRDEFTERDLIILKDPRFSRLLPLWMRVLEEEGFRCVHIVALRHPGAVAGSLGHRNGLSLRASTLAWLAHSLDAERATRGQPRVFVSFENFMRDWRSEMERVSRDLDLQWPRTLSEVAEEVEEFIEPGLVHETSAAPSKGPAAFVAPVYDVFRRWSQDEVRPGDRALLDSWAKSMAPLRREASAVAKISHDRDRAIARSRQKSSGGLPSDKAWRPIRNRGYDLEAAVAWTWLRRERQHVRAMRRAGREISRLRQGLAEAERTRALMPRVVRRLRAVRNRQAPPPPPHPMTEKEATTW